MSSSSCSSSKKMITLTSSDKETFEVEESVIIQSQTIKHMIEDDCADNGIPLPNVTGEILSKVIEFCKKHAAAAADDDSDKDDDGGAKKHKKDDEVKNWDADFVKVDQATLFGLILAANYLNIKALLDLTCQAAADMIKDKKPEEVREMFNIVNDFSPEEEEKIRKENAWAFD